MNDAPTLAAPRPMSSWSGSIRCRFVAARVRAIEIDSIKPISDINIAEPIRLVQISIEKDGKDMGGRS